MNQKIFFIYNNGLTLTTSSLEANPQNTGNRFLFELQNFQIVNGGQTIRSIYEYLMGQDVNKIANLRKASVLVRIFKVSSDDCLKNKIAEYTNSQNAISAKDLKSVDQKQIQIEAYLKPFNIQYIRKTATNHGCAPLHHRTLLLIHHFEGGSHMSRKLRLSNEELSVLCEQVALVLRAGLFQCESQYGHLQTH